MMPVQFPKPEFKLKKEGEKQYIFDGIRKMWLHLTEEEWVRQNFVAYLVKQMQYPTALIALEKALTLNDLRKRFDILVYNKAHQPWMMIECKAPTVQLNEEVLQQALRYNMTIPVNYIVLTNGESTVGWEKKDNGLVLLTTLPQMV